MRIGVHQVITFATEPFRGNPAFVVSPPVRLPDRTLIALAAELRETVLSVIHPISGEDRLALSFFGAQGAHPGAGHSALAAAHVALARQGFGDTITFRLADGSERVAARKDGRISFNWPVMPGEPVDRHADLAAALGVTPRDTLVAPFGYVAVYDDPTVVADLRPDLNAIERFDRGAVIATAPGRDSDIVLRVFAPRLGLPEDPVCGTAHRILTPYWAEQLGRSQLHSRQLSSRGGDLWCRLDGNRVAIAGVARGFLEGFLDLAER